MRILSPLCPPSAWYGSHSKTAFLLPQWANKILIVHYLYPVILNYQLFTENSRQDMEAEFPAFLL